MTPGLQRLVALARAECLGGALSSLQSTAEVQNDVMDHMAELPLPEQSSLAHGLMSSVPEPAKPHERRFDVAEIPRLLETVRRSSAGSPIYGGFVLPALEMVASANHADRATFAEALLSMLRVKKTQRFAAAVFVGSIGFREHLERKLQSSRPTRGP